MMVLVVVATEALINGDGNSRKERKHNWTGIGRKGGT
jgi:hypothetical protein